MEGAINGRIAMAVTQAYTRTEFDRASGLAAQLFESLAPNPLPPMSVLNVNYPAREEAKGVVTAVMEELVYDEVYTPSVLEDGTKAYTLNGVIEENRRQSDDYAKLEDGFATVTVLHYDMTDRRSTNFWNSLI
jgi:broad specificity polyphosphatase/5'/3'-nucleotidase SurE